MERGGEASSSLSRDSIEPAVESLQQRRSQDETGRQEFLIRSALLRCMANEQEPKLAAVEMVAKLSPRGTSILGSPPGTPLFIATEKRVIRLMASRHFLSLTPLGYLLAFPGTKGRRMRTRVGCGNRAGAGKERCMPTKLRSKLPSRVLRNLQRDCAVELDGIGAPPALDPRYSECAPSGFAKRWRFPGV